MPLASDKLTGSFFLVLDDCLVQFSKGLGCVGDELCSCLLHADLHLDDETGIQSIKTM